MFSALSWQVKLGITIICLTIVSLLGIIIYQHITHQDQLNEVQQSMVEQKQLLDNIVRSQASYASKEDIANYAKQRDINLDTIQSDLDGLNARIIGINGITVVSTAQDASNLPSTGTEPRTDTPAAGVGSDPYGYLTNEQKFTLNENFSNIVVPFGEVGFSAWKDKPWDVNIPARQYLLTSVLGEDDNGRHYSYSKLAIQSGDKTYDIKIDDAKFLEEYPSSTLSWWNPRLFAVGNIGAKFTSTGTKAEITPGGMISVISYGQFKNSPTLSIMGVGAGYGLVDRKLEIIVSPIQYNLGGVLPLIKNTYVGPNIQFNTSGDVTIGAGISVGL